VSCFLSVAVSVLKEISCNVTTHTHTHTHLRSDPEHQGDVNGIFIRSHLEHLSGQVSDILGDDSPADKYECLSRGWCPLQSSLPSSISFWEVQSVFWELMMMLLLRGGRAWRPLHCDHLWSILHSNMISNHSLYTNQSSENYRQRCLVASRRNVVRNSIWILPTKYLFHTVGIFKMP
jgi:hypothetical protein